MRGFGRPEPSLLGVSTGGNTAGNTGPVPSGLILAGGSNITLSQTTSPFGVAGVTIDGAAGGAGAGTDGAITGGSITVNTSGISINLPAYLTTAMGSNRGSDFVQATAAFAGTSASGTIASNGISVSVGPYITTAMASNRTTDFVAATAAFAGTSASGTIASNGISVSIGAYLTTAALSNHSHGVSFTSGSVAFQTLSFTNSNGISFNSGTQGIFASHNAITTARASTDAIGLNTAQSNVTWTVNSSGLSLDARGYAGTTTGFAGANISGSMTHNSVGLNLSLSVAAPGGGAGVDRKYMELMDGARMTTCAILNNATYSNRVVFVPFVMKEGGSLSVNTVEMYLSRTGGTILLATMGVAFYTMANSTSMNLAFSTTHVFSLQSSVSWSGIRGYQFTGMGANVLTAGEWVFGFYNSAAASNSIGLNVMGGDGFALAGYVFTGTDQTSATGSQSHLVNMWGVFNATTAAFPAAVAKSSISGGMPSANSPDIYAVVRE